MSWMLNVLTIAEIEISEAYFYFEGKRQGLGDEFLDRLDEVLARISEAPELYALERNGIRRVKLRQFPYVLGYSVDADRIIVLGVLHGSRNPKEWDGRLK